MDEGPDDPPADDDASDTGPEVRVFFVRSNDSGIWVEPESHRLDGPADAIAQAAMTVLFAGEPYDDALSTAVPDGVEVLATNIRDRTLIVDVSSAIQDHSTGSAGEVAFAEQLAHTAAAFDTVDRVQLWVEGAAITELWGHLDWSQPIEPDPFALSPITITDPAAGPDVARADVGQITVSGEATVFEATFGIRLLDSNGVVVDEEFVMASMGAPERGSWQHTFTVDTPGDYVIEVEEYDASDGEGRPPFVASRTIEVR